MPLIQLNTIDKTITCLTLQKSNLSAFLTQVGGTAADVTRVGEQLAILESLVEHCDLYDANKKVANAVKDRAWRGPVTGDPLEIPTTAAYVPPFPLVEDIVGQLNSANRRFREGPGYTNDEVGVALGFFTATPEPPTNPTSVTPTLDAFAAASGGVVSCVVGNRVESDGWQAFIMRSGSTEWEMVGTYTGKSADVLISLTNPGQPEIIQIRIQLRKGNQNYGNVSAALTVTLNP